MSSNSGAVPRRRLSDWAKSRSRPRDAATGYLKPRHCSFYSAGHTVHWIQASHSANSPERFGLLSEVEGDVITIDFGNEVKRYRNHEVERLVEVVGPRRWVFVRERYCLLRNRTNVYFSIADADAPWTPCEVVPPAAVTPESLTERLETYGGFVVPGRELFRRH